jgi:hypothetical protein
MTTIIVSDNTTGATFSGTRDAQVFARNPNDAFGANTTLEISYWQDDVADYRCLLLAFTGLPSVPTANVSAATLSLWLEAYNVNGPATSPPSFDRILRNWVEAQVTANEWATGSAWTTLAGRGSGSDIAASSSGTVALSTTTGAYMDLVLPAGMLADIQAWMRGTAANYGWNAMIPSQAFGDDRVFTSREGTDGHRPKLSVTYDVPPTTYPIHSELVF